MSGQDADQVAVELIAKVDGFDAAVGRSASKFDAATDKIMKSGSDAERVLQNLKRKMADALSAGDSGKANALASQIAQIEGALGAVEKRSGSARAAQMELSHVVRSVASQFAAGAPPVQIFSTHIGQVAQAAGLASGGLGGWTIAITAAGVALGSIIGILSEFILKTKGSNAEIEEAIKDLREHAEKAQIAAIAQDKFSRTTEGLNEAIRKHNELLKQANEESKTFAERAQADAEKQVEKAKATIQATIALLEQAKAEAALQEQRAQAPGQRGEIAALGTEQKDRRQAFYEKEIAAQKNALETLQTIVRVWSSHVAAETGERLADPVEAVKAQYKALIEQTRIRLRDEKATSAEIQKQVRLLAQKRDAEIKALRDTDKNKNREVGREVTPEEAASIARSAGLIVNSASRTYAQQKALYDAWVKAGRPSDNPVAMPGSSAHEGAKGRWALDIQFGQGVTPDLLRKVFAAQGINLTKVFKERGHFHVEGSRSEADSADADAARAADQEVARRQGFENELASVQDDELNLRHSLVTSVAELAKIERDSIILARDKYDDNLKAQEALGKLLPQEAEELKKANDERAKLRLEIADRREQERKFRLQEAAQRQALDLASASTEGQVQLLQGQEQLVQTQKERREIERRLVDLQYEEERARLQYLINYNERLKLQEGISESEKQEAEAQAEIARAKLATLDQRKGNALQGVDQNTMGPFQAYLDTIPDTMGKINEALQSVAAGGLQSFIDGLANAIVNFQSLGQVGRAALLQVAAGIVKLGLQQLLLATVGQALGTAATTAASAQAAAVGAAWAPAAAMAALATLGANAGPAAAALAGTTALAQALALPKFKDGGRLFGPGGPTGDKIPLMGSADEYMIKARSARSLGYDTLDYINRTGELPYLFAGGGRIRRVSPSNSPALRAGGGRVGIDDDFRRELRDTVREAASAMPNIALYAGLDPAEMLERALASPAGEKALYANMGRNSGRAKAAIDR